MNSDLTGRRHNMKYKFVSSFNNLPPTAPVPEKLVDYFQICAFPDKTLGTYQVRKYVINNDNVFVDIKDLKLTKKELKKLLSYRKQNEYKVYPVYDLKMIPRANLSDVLELKSDMTTKSYDDYGYASF